MLQIDLHLTQGEKSASLARTDVWCCAGGGRDPEKPRKNSRLRTQTDGYRTHAYSSAKYLQAFLIMIISARGIQREAEFYNLYDERQHAKENNNCIGISTGHN